MSSRLRTLLENFLNYPAVHPGAALAIVALLTALAALATSRLRAEASLEAMFSRDDPAAAALIRVLNEFGAAEELLVLATVPSGQHPGQPDPTRLLAFARRFEEAVTSSSDALQLCDGVIYRSDAQTRQFFERVLVPNGLFYLDPDALRAARQRLSRQQMQQQIARNEAMLSQPGPAAQAAAKVLLKDPLRLHEFVLDRFAAQRAFKTYEGGDAFISPDGRSILIRVPGKRPPSDLEFAKHFTSTIESRAAVSNADGLGISLSGSYAIAATSERAIRRDMKLSVLSSVLCLFGLFMLAYRHPLRSFTLAFLPVALGVLFGFGLYALWRPTLNPLTGVIGAILAGMGIDYSVYYLSHYERRRASGLTPGQAVANTVREIFPALFAAWVTSVIGFLAIGFSSVTALRDFALLGAMGLAGTLFAAVWVLPALLAATDRRSTSHLQRRNHVGFRAQPALAWVARHSMAVLLASLAILLVAGIIAGSAGRNIVPLETDLTVMHPRPNPAIEAQAEIARLFGSAADSLIVHLKTRSPEALVSLAHRASQRLSTPAVRSHGVAATYGLATLLPDPQIAEARFKEINPGEADRVVKDFEAAVQTSRFNPKAYEPYSEFLRTLLLPHDAPSITTLLPYRQLARTLLPTSAFEPGAQVPTEAITLVFLDQPPEDRQSRDTAIETIRSALADLPGATLTGLTVISHDTELDVQRDLPRLLGVAVVLVLSYLLLQFRSLADTLLSLLPAIFSLLCLLAVMRLTGQKLNMMNLIALPLLIGIDVDYGIFLVSLARASRRQDSRESTVDRISASAHAVALCALSTALGFGSLITTSVPAIRSLGFVVGVGVLSCLVGTLFLLAPILFSLRLRPADAG